MRNKLLPALGLAASVLALVAGILFSQWKAPPAATADSVEATPQPSAISSPESKTHLSELHPTSPSPSTVAAPPPGQSPANLQGSPTPAKPPPRVYEPGPGKYRTAQNPIARRALALVGKDHDAENIWLSAINDPTLPAEERKDLIEDLNEDGISNPSRPAPSDLPLITSRIHLIEQLVSSAMDDVNAAAFKEAHKDLVNMYDRLTQR